MIRTEDFEKVEVDGAVALWDWLDAHHAGERSVWLVTYKKPDPRHVSTGEVLDALIAHGWIDWIRRKLDEAPTMQLIAPRKVQHWAQSYKDRAERLVAQGRMRPMDAAVIERDRASGLWDFMADVDALIVPDDLDAALRGTARDYYEGTGASHRRNLLRWVKLAKTEKTRVKRIESIAAACRVGERIPQM